jgi:hypothetical protein
MQKQQSLFFPLLLIAVGVLWLLVDMNVIPSANLWALTHIWPYLLILLGIGVIVRAQWGAAGTVVSVLLILGAVAAVVYAPQLGWAGGPDWNLGEGFAGSGKIKSETRQVETFDAVAINYPAQVIIRQDDSESVKVEADDNLLDQLGTVVRDGRLVIENSEREWARRVSPSETVKITITVKDLKEVDFSSAGTLLVEGLDTEDLDLDLSGAGEVKLTDLKAGRLVCNLTGAGNLRADGEAGSVDIEIDGFGNFYGNELHADRADVTINGAGNVNLGVKTYLMAEINGAGSVGYYGTSDVNQRVNGAGSVRRLNE